jgi:hypothetical protein
MRLLSCGYGQEERAGAARVYGDPPICSSISMEFAAGDRWRPGGI